MERHQRAAGTAVVRALLCVALLAGPAESAPDLASAPEGSAEGRAMPDGIEPVAPGIFRSAQPTPAELGVARQRGLRTVLVLRSEVPKEEFLGAARLGLAVVHVPMSAEGLPSMEELDRALDAMLDPTRQPILVHCAHGEERTGVVIAAYRVVAQDWTPAAAAAEARENGFGFEHLEGFLARYRAHRADRPAGKP